MSTQTEKRQSSDGPERPCWDGARRILIVDDDHDFSAAIGEILDSEGYTVSLAHGAQEACDRAAEFGADIALLDIRLGRDSGIDLIGRLKSVREGVLCVMMTGHAALDTAIQALQQGAYDYLRKPIDGLDLLATLDRCFETIRLREDTCATEEARARLAAAVEHAAEAILITDPDGTIQYVNPAFETITGYASEEALGSTPRILRSGKMDDSFYKELWTTLAGGGVWVGRFTNRTKSGQFVEQESTISSIRDGRGHIVSYVSVARDVTREMELEAQLRHAQKLEAIGTLAGGIAHDFNNTLSPILGYAEMAMNEVGPGSDLWQHLSEIHKAGERASALVRQILAFSRPSEWERKLVLMKGIVEECMKLLRSSLPSTISIELDLEECPPVLADPTQMHQVIMNLCTNAFHAMQEHGGVLTTSLHPVTIAAGPVLTGAAPPPGNYVRLAVTDTGQGMSPETLERIFEPYFTTKKLGQGTGLGLATVHGIVHAHLGHIAVESTPGRGAEFRVYLPVAAVPESPEPKAPASERAWYGSERILAVDDEPAIIAMLKRGLETMGYHVDGYTDSMAALEAFLGAPDAYDAILTDQTMPRLTGLELAQRAIKMKPGIPVMLITGFSESVDEQITRSAGIRAFLFKPAPPRKIAEQLRKILPPPSG